MEETKNRQVNTHSLNKNGVRSTSKMVSGMKMTEADFNHKRTLRKSHLDRLERTELVGHAESWDETRPAGLRAGAVKVAMTLVVQGKAKTPGGRWRE